LNSKIRDCKQDWVGKFLLKERKRKIERQTDKTKTVFKCKKEKEKGKDRHTRQK
jgi:hypothetical protein